VPKSAAVVVIMIGRKRRTTGLVDLCLGLPDVLHGIAKRNAR
jgi:hypothetical protein